MTEAEVLNEAADLIEERGWWPGMNGGDRGNRVCAAIAINVAGGFSADAVKPAVWMLRCYLGTDVVFWNDAPGRTASEVTTALRAAAQAVTT